MNKTDIAILVALVGALLLWMGFGQQLMGNKPVAPPEQAVTLTGETEAPIEEGEGATPVQNNVAIPVPEIVPPQVIRAKEQTVVLTNALASYTLTSHGGGVSHAVMHNYRATLDPDSGPRELDQSSYPSLIYKGIEGLGEDADFSISPLSDTNGFLLQAVRADGLELHRRITLGDSYLLEVEDRFINRSDKAVELVAPQIAIGPMQQDAGQAKQRGIVYLGADSLLPGTEKVQHYGRKIPRWFTNKRKSTGTLPLEVQYYLGQSEEQPMGQAVDWLATKSKYFVSILRPEETAVRAQITAFRKQDPQETSEPGYTPKSATVESVQGIMTLNDTALEAGSESVMKHSLYIGPKKFSRLNQLGYEQQGVMEFGRMTPISILLLKMLNWIKAHIFPFAQGFGPAIVLLTVLVRIVFWPVTHKSTQSMRRMSEIQPLIKEINEKYKENAQKRQEETMKLYKEHKVNPLGGCLPLVIQIPVFIALFVMLRSAIELRFAPFLWVADLSEPERLLADVLPIPLNILPLIMTAATFLQQKLMPTGGDTQQQKMMAFMPLMMLFILYNFPAGLVLYWTTNQVLMMVQQVIMKKHHPKPA